MTDSKPTLLSINNYHYLRGGAESVYFDHAELFRAVGWSTAFFSMQHPQNRDCDESAYFIDELELGHSYSLLKKAGMATKVIYSHESRRKLSALLDKLNPDVAHVHSVYHHISPSILPLLKERGIPVVLTAHDLKLLCPAYTMLSQGQVCEACKGGKTWNVLRKKCIKNSTALSFLVGLEAAVHGFLNTYADNVTALVLPSKFYRNKFIEWGWPPDRLHYIPNYVVTGDFEPQYQPGDYFLYFGRLLRDKGVDTLIRAAARSGIALRVAGTGPDQQSFQALAQQTGANVEFLGFRSGDDLHAQIRGARAIVLPSEWYENAPISLLEAYALGKPVIGADIGGIPEMIEPAQTGWLHESGSLNQLAGLLAEVDCHSAEQLETMGQAARARVETRFSPEKYLRNMQALYSEICH